MSTEQTENVDSIPNEGNATNEQATSVGVASHISSVNVEATNAPPSGSGEKENEDSSATRKRKVSEVINDEPPAKRLASVELGTSSIAATPGNITDAGAFKEAAPVSAAPDSNAPSTSVPQAPGPYMPMMSNAATSAPVNIPTPMKFQIKFLIENGNAGLVIGKGGANIRTFQAESGCDIKLSQNNQFFPGTNNRVVMIVGPTLNQLILALRLLFNKLNEAFVNVPNPTNLEFKLAVPCSAAGVIIGKGGDNVRSFKTQSGAENISCTPQESMPVQGLNERFVVIRGTPHQQLTAAELVIQAMCVDHTSFHYENPNTSYKESAGAMRGGAGYGYGSGHFQQQAMGASGYPSQPPYGGGGSNGADNDKQIVQISDAVVGAIVGRGGSTIKQMMTDSNCFIKISQKGEYVPGTTNRMITITGSKSNVAYAQKLIQDRLAGLSDRSNGSGGGSNPYNNNQYAAAAAAYYGPGATPAGYGYSNTGAYGAATGAYGAATGAYGAATGAYGAATGPTGYGYSNAGGYGADQNAYAGMYGSYGSAAPPSANINTNGGASNPSVAGNGDYNSYAGRSDAYAPSRTY